MSSKKARYVCVVRVIPLIRFVVTYCIGHQDPASFAISR